MESEETSQHPIDDEVHPVGGWVVAVLGLLMCLAPMARGARENSLRFAVELLMGVGIMLLGVAMLIPKGRARRLVVCAWYASIGAWIALMVFWRVM